MMSADRLKILREANQIDNNIPTILHNETTGEYISIPPCLIYGMNYEKALDNPWCWTSHALKQWRDTVNKSIEAYNKKSRNTPKERNDS